MTLESFRRDYGYDESSETQTNALSVGLQQLGAFGGCFLAWPITARLGRRKSLVIFSLVFCAAALVQTVNTHSLLVFYLARVLAGLGLGAATVVIPMYSSEMSSKDLRGQIGSFFQLFFTFVRQDKGCCVLQFADLYAGNICLLLDRLRGVFHAQSAVGAVADSRGPASRARSAARCRSPDFEREHAVVDEKGSARGGLAESTVDSG